MAATFQLEIATPEKLVLRADVSEAQIPGANGELGILPGHAAIISELQAGELSYVTEGQRHHLAVASGWMEMSNNVARVLVDACERPNEIDAKRAEEAMKRANERLASAGQNLDMARALNAAKRAQARLAVAKLNK